MDSDEEKAWIQMRKRHRQHKNQKTIILREPLEAGRLQATRKTLRGEDLQPRIRKLDNHDKKRKTVFKDPKHLNTYLLHPIQRDIARAVRQQTRRNARRKETGGVRKF